MWLCPVLLLEVVEVVEGAALLWLNLRLRLHADDGDLRTWWV